MALEAGMNFLHEGYSDRERKQVTLEREDGGWRIIRES